MFATNTNNAAVKTTSYKVVLPFYMYAALSFVAATIMLFFSSGTLLHHYFQPRVLATTHTMALGWGTMIILGASHQLVPVIIEGKLYSERLAYASFILAAIGIPLLVYAFFVFNMGAPAILGASLIVLSLLSFLINIALSISESHSENVHAIFVLTATGWLLLTVTLGFILLLNFTHILLPADSVRYLPLHAHLGIIGWFFLLITGVGSRLIPMFMISKYTNTRLLWWIYALINGALLCYTILFLLQAKEVLIIVPAVLFLSAITGFIYYCYKSAKQRIRKQIDNQVKVSLLSVLMMLFPVLLLLLIIILSGFIKKPSTIITAYGFTIFFGWITAIILGMTFKTLPFIVWNKVYHQRSVSGKTPSPKDIFNHKNFRIMSVAYLLGFVVFSTGIFTSIVLLLQSGAVLLIITSVMYAVNVLSIMRHKAENGNDN